MTDRVEVNVVAFQEGELWIAQCVEYDIAAFAKSLPELPRALERAVAANLCVNADLGRNALDGVPPVPARFREMFDHSHMDVKTRDENNSTTRLPVRIRDLRVADAA